MNLGRIGVALSLVPFAAIAFGAALAYLAHFEKSLCDFSGFPVGYSRKTRGFS